MGTSSSADQMNAGSVGNNSNKYRYLWGKLNWIWTWTCRSTDFWTQVTKNTIARRSKSLLHGGRESPPYSYFILPTSVPGSITSFLSSFHHHEIRQFPFYLTPTGTYSFWWLRSQWSEKIRLPWKKQLFWFSSHWAFEEWWRQTYWPQWTF